MGDETIGTTTRVKRGNHACIVCRERKVKCSGSSPCKNCINRSEQCVFDHDEKKVTVSERYINELKRKADKLASPDDSTTTKDGPSPIRPQHNSQYAAPERGIPLTNSLNDSARPSISLTNPFASGQSTFVTDPHGRRRFLGPSSTWAYSRQVMLLVKTHLDQCESPEFPMHVDGKAYPINWTTSNTSTTLSRHRLPTLDHALYLVNVVRFHVDQTYHLFEEASFVEQLRSFYDDQQTTSSLAIRLWYVQFLVVLAYGKAISVQHGPDDSLPGEDYFKRAIENLPDINGMYEEPLSAIETLCAIALYFQCVDHRNSAYTYLGMALRIALSQGLHREPKTGLFSDSEAAKRCDIWWTIYILDRKFSSLMGAPNSIHDDDITLKLPTSCAGPRRGDALSIHVKLSRLLARLLNTVYSVDGRLDSRFIKSIQDVLRSMAELAPELEASFGFQFNDYGTTSRISATLNLCYHQCIVLATRPLLMSLIQDKLARSQDRGSDDSRPVIEPVRALLRTCSESALKSVRILSSLKTQDLLETFLPFDLESAFSSAFVLCMIRAIQPFPNVDDSVMEKAMSIISLMARRGSVAASFRQKELQGLQEILHLVGIQQANMAYDDLPTAASSVYIPNANESSSILHQSDPSLQCPSYFTSLNDVGLSPEDMLSVAQMLEWDQTFPAVDLSASNFPFWVFTEDG